MDEHSSIKIVSVWLLQSVSFTASIADAKDIVIITSAIIATGYTLWRWRKDIKKNNQNNQKGN